MAGKNKLFQLIKKIITNTASKEEKDRVDGELFEPSIYSKWNKQKMGDRKKLEKRIVRKVQVGMKQTYKISPLRYASIRFGKIAALLLLFSICAIYGVRYFGDTTSIPVVEQVEILQPGKELASFIFSDGRVLNLNSLEVGETVVAAGFILRKVENGKLEYRNLGQSLEPKSARGWHVVSTPIGGKFQINLSDGTDVWMNAGSKLEFPTHFSGSERKVRVSGEVYFEVKPNVRKPFIVSTPEMDIKVLGTSFNVSAYEDQASKKVSLVEGEVQVNTSFSRSKLQPGQQASIGNMQMEVEDFDVESVIAWKNDCFIFKNKNIKEIMSVLARWYGAEIEYKGEGWEELNYTIRMSRRDNLKEVLSIIELTESVNFEIKGRRILVVK